MWNDPNSIDFHGSHDKICYTQLFSFRQYSVYVIESAQGTMQLGSNQNNVFSLFILLSLTYQSAFIRLSFKICNITSGFPVVCEHNAQQRPDGAIRNPELRSVGDSRDIFTQRQCTYSSPAIQLSSSYPTCEFEITRN